MPFPLESYARKSIEDHFRRKKLIWNEPYFINILKTSDKRFDVYFAILALRDCGTMDSIPVLKEKLFYPMQDVKCIAILTIAHIAGAKETEFYADVLSNPDYREKGYAMWAIQEAADERAINSVLNYFRKNHSKLKNGKLTNATLAHGLEFLERHLQENDEIRAFFSDVEGFWEKLPQGERIEIAKRVSFFSDRKMPPEA